MGENRKGHQGTPTKGTRTKAKGGRIEGGRWGWVEQEGVVVVRKWRQLYLNNIKGFFFN